MTLRIMIGFVLGVPAIALAVDSIVAQGWATATLNDNGAVYNRTSANGDSLPDGLSCTASGSRTVMGLASGVMMRARDYGKTVTRNRFGSLSLGYKLYTDIDPTSKPNLKLEVETKYALTAYISLEASPGSASVSARSDLVGKSTSGQLNSPGLFESSETGGEWRTGPRLSYNAKNVNWNRESDGRWSTQLRLASNTLQAEATGYHNKSGGTMIVLVANAGSSAEINGSTFQPYTSSTATPQIAGTAHGTAGLPVPFEIFTANNVLLDSCVMVMPDDGSYNILMNACPNGRYKLYFNPPSGLRKLIEWDYVSPGLTGPDFHFKWGDVNDDNVIDQADLNYILAVMGKGANDYEWQGMFGSNTGTGLWANRADLNRDGVVTSSDYLTAYGNFGAVGD